MPCEWNSLPLDTALLHIVREGGSFMRHSVCLAFSDARHRWRCLCGSFLMVRQCRPAQSSVPIRHSAVAGAAIFLLLFSSAGHATSEPIRADPWQIIHIARELGPAEVQRDGMNDPQIRGELDGQSYRIDFYGCRLGRDCESILLSARLAFDGEDDADASEFPQEWNRRKLFGRAWVDSGRRGRAQMVLDHPILLGQGIAEPVFRASLGQWQAALGEFTREFTKWSGSP